MGATRSDSVTAVFSNTPQAEHYTHLPHTSVLKLIFTFSASWKRYTKWIKNNTFKEGKIHVSPQFPVLTFSSAKSKLSAQVCEVKRVSSKNIKHRTSLMFPNARCPACLCTCGHGYWWRALIQRYWGSKCSHSKHTPWPQRRASPVPCC